MKDLSLHILDIMQNSLQAGAIQVHVSITEDLLNNLLTIEIRDNGKGIKSNLIDKITDPFYTKDSKKKVGMGLALLKQNAEMAGGGLQLKAFESGGLQIKARFKLDHIDRPPMGDVSETINNVFLTNPEVRLIYEHIRSDEKIKLDTAEIVKAVEGLDLQLREVRSAVKEFIDETLKGSSDIK